MIKCSKCNYSTMRKFNLERHHFNKHNKKEQIIINQENNTNSTENNTNSTENKRIKKFNCKKCNKSYNTTKYLNNHEAICKGISILTCPKCMKTFKHQSNKSKHMKTNSCKAKSIINYNNPNITNNITNNNIIIINSYGNERIDYLTINKILEMCKKAPSSSIIPNYIEAKHFNKDFPENNNIKYENNTCFKFIDNQWKNININLLSDELILKTSNELNDKFKENKKIFEDHFKNEEVLEYVHKHFNYLDLSINTKLYKVIKTKIKDLIKSPLLLLLL